MARRGAVEPPKEEENELSYMQPEILPVQIMIDVLKEHGMKIAPLQEADRTHIIRLFHKHVCPKHQRDYRDNRRGKILTALRRKRERGSNEDNWRKMVMDSKERTLSSTNTSDASAERLKPPPSCINKERKTIKLGGSAKAPSSSLDFIVVKRRSSEESDQGPEIKSRKLSDGEKDSEQKKTKDTEDHVKTDKIRKVDDEDASDMTSLENGKKLKHDRKPITWP